MPTAALFRTSDIASGVVLSFVVAVALVAASGEAHAQAGAGASGRDCFDQAGAHTDVSPDLLRAVAHVESGMRPEAVNRTHVARTGTVDIGLMQINSGWLPRLRRQGIDEAALQEPCTNIAVGAGLLREAIAARGNTWDAVGSYNAACTQLKGPACTQRRQWYAWKVYRQMVRQAPDGPHGKAIAEPPFAPVRPGTEHRPPMPLASVQAAPREPIRIVTLAWPAAQEPAR